MIRAFSRLVGAVVLSAMWSAPAWSAEAACLIAVTDFDRKGETVPTSLAETVSARVEAAVLQTVTDIQFPCRLQSRDRTRALVRASRTSCPSDDCFTPVLQAIGADLVLFGIVDQREGGAFVARLRLLDHTGLVVESGEESASDPERLRYSVQQAATTLMKKALFRRFGTLVSFRTEIGGAQVHVASQAHAVPADVWVLPGQQVSFLLGSDSFDVSTVELLQLRGTGAQATLRDHKAAGAIVKTTVVVAFTVGGGVAARMLWKTNPEITDMTEDQQRTVHFLVGAGVGFLVGVFVAVPVGNAVAKPTVDVQSRPALTFSLSPGGVGLQSTALSVVLGPGGLSGSFY